MPIYLNYSVIKLYLDILRPNWLEHQSWYCWVSGSYKIQTDFVILITVLGDYLCSHASWQLAFCWDEGGYSVLGVWRGALPENPTNKGNPPQAWWIPCITTWLPVAFSLVRFLHSPHWHSPCCLPIAYWLKLIKLGTHLLMQPLSRGRTILVEYIQLKLRIMFKR